MGFPIEDTSKDEETIGLLDEETFEDEKSSMSQVEGSPVRGIWWKASPMNALWIYLVSASLLQLYATTNRLTFRPPPSAEGACNCSSSPDVPQYFQTSPELWAGPTATGRAPFLAQTNPVFFTPTATFVPNDPLETGEPIIGQAQNDSIFHLMGHLSPYFPNPSGFGVNEYPLPPGANISQVQV